MPVHQSPPRSAALLVLSLALLSAGCGSTTWSRMVDAETREDEAVHDLSTNLRVVATRLTPGLSAERARLECERTLCSVEERRKLEEAATQRARQTVAFVVGVYTRDPGWSDLDRAKSQWRVRLDVGGERLPPDGIQAMAREQAQQARLFPYLDGFLVGYEIVFPRPAPLQGKAAAPCRLLISGLLGTVALNWEE